jgi:hypothetical protein
MTETTYGREPETIVEMVQPRCSLRFGSMPCRAAIDNGQSITNLSRNLPLHGTMRVSLPVSSDVAPDLSFAFKCTTSVQASAVAFYAFDAAMTFVSGQSYCASIFVKAAEIGILCVNTRTEAFGVNGGASFNLSDQNVRPFSGPTAGIIDIGNGWYRCWVSATATANVTGGHIWWRLSKNHSANAPTFTSTGGEGLLMFGPMIQTGTGPTNYIPTTDAPVTKRFGTATTKCYQTWATCSDRESINQDGRLTWRFRKPDAGIKPMYGGTANDIETNPIPLLRDVSVTSSAINVGAQREGQSPLGIRSTVTMQFDEAPWDDHVGDYYLADRSSVQGNFWAKWRARNAFYNGILLRTYEGYKGQALSAMQRRDHVFDTITGPSAGGVTITGKDPLRLAELKDAQFPRATDIRLVGEIDDVTTALRVRAIEADLSANFGNTGARRFAAMGREIVQYTGYTLVETGIYDLTGVTRGALGTEAAQQSDDSALQRCGRYERVRPWEIAADLIDNHTQIPAGYRDAAEWDDEGNEYLITQFTNVTFPAPKSVEKILGDMCQQGSFSIWWDDRQQKIPLLANRPPKDAPVEITDRLNILAGSAAVTDNPDAQITRVAIYYSPRSPFDLERPENYRTLRLSIDGDVEAPAAAGAVRTLTIFAYAVTRDANAFRLATRLLLRYRLIPKYLSLELDAKDRAVKIGDVIAVTTAAFVDSEGGMVSTVWQVIKSEETRPGDALRVELQSAAFIGRFGTIMPSTATDDYASATANEKATGLYIADHRTGLMPNGDPPYLIQ